jgi:flagellar biosynthesis protein FlhB
MNRYRLSMDLQLFAGEKTEKATPRKRQDARKKGQVAKSMDLPASLVLFFGFLLMFGFGDFYKERLHQLFIVTFDDYLLMELSMANVQMIFGSLMVQGGILLAPIFVMAVVVAILGNYLQFGFLVSGDPLMMKLSKLNPIEGFKKIFSMKSVFEFFKTLFKLTIIGIVVYLTLWDERARLLQLAHVPLEEILSYSASLTLNLGLKIGAALIVLALVDFLYQKYEFEKSLKMSKQDIKDEYKKTEGDPLIKGKIRERQRKMALQRMMQEVPKADVIITNPTHFAVAIRYDSSQMEAPTVIAKGMDYIALKIRSIAEEHGIVMMENKPLARTLYDQVEIGQSVPPELFQAVAEVLAYVYKLKGRAN